ncbi:secondary thiamine-phosphate synthase enzyme YjbQ [candidate division WWE3 bacterium]|uniref:Secondary thiamine-phosphate synthase enzyme YjbQ n=1 Tax=candidate division WWE3 bacterium TaxID=2053526 RepID=A0A955RX11_UNCKA|nr:secondary thiamine-phosphate synthase enzyme YjbQ [candidate division WWE3 bacterium]
MLSIATNSSREILDIIDTIQSTIDASKIKATVCHISVLHTTAAITTADLDPGTDQDYLNFFDQLTPTIQWKHPHDPSHTPDHIWSTIIGTQRTIPIKNGKLLLGTWQRIVLIELDGPRERTIVVTTD